MRILGKPIFFSSLTLLLFTLAVFAAELKEAEPKRVLVIYSYHEGLLWERLIDDSLRATLAAKSTGPIDLNVEHTDRVSYPDDAYLHKLVDLYRRKYSDPNMDLVIGIDDEATDLLLRYGEELFPGVPMVFVTAERKDLQRNSLKPNMTSLFWGVDIEGTVEIIQQVLPETRHLFIISGSSLSDLAVNGLARTVLGQYVSRLDITYLVDNSIEDLLQKVAQLPENSAVIYLVFSRDAEGKSFVPREILSLISEKANAPVFGIVGTYLEQGIVGGSLLSSEVQGKRCAEIGLRILHGESAVDIVPEKTLNVPMFDSRQLKRWGISEDKLPAGSIVRFKEPSAWEGHKREIIGAAVLIVAQALLISVLLMQRVRRRRVERSLVEAESKFRTVADLTYDWEYWANLDGTLHYVSPSCERISGYKIEEFIENPHIFREIIIPEDKDVWDQHYHNFRNERSRREIQFRIRTRTGEIRWIEHACQPITDSQGELQGIRASNRDITQRKQAELDVQKHREKLTQISHIVTLGELSASLAHELNQPLTAILSNAQVAQRFLTMDPTDLDEVREILSDIVKDDKRARDIIYKLRALMRRGQLEIKTLDLNKVVREVVELVIGNAFNKKVSFVLELADGLPPARGDAIQLEQVLLNLILNSSEAMVTFDGQFREVRLSTEQNDKSTLKVSVRDMGTGIDEENIEGIFDAFFTTKPEGMGMGLAICRSIIEAHGGRLWAENNPDQGATVSFTVPVVE
jgi:PAS domain S-box-containing protein